MHDFEFDDLSYHEIARKGKELRDLRRNRRKYKNEYILYEPIVLFLKKHSDLISELNELSNKVLQVESFLANMHYNERSKINDISFIEKDNKSYENIAMEDLIMLNKILNKFSSKYSSDILTIPSKDENGEMEFSIWLDVSPSFKSLKDSIIKIKNNIEKFFKTDLENKYVDIVISDYLSRDIDGKNKIDAMIKIYECDLLVYTIHGRCYGNLENAKQNKKRKRRK